MINMYCNNNRVIGSVCAAHDSSDACCASCDATYAT